MHSVYSLYRGCGRLTQVFFFCGTQLQYMSLDVCRISLHFSKYTHLAPALLNVKQYRKFRSAGILLKSETRLYRQETETRQMDIG
jgi:hypothetical protein